jgi:hypothetical protein
VRIEDRRYCQLHGRPYEAALAAAQSFSAAFGMKLMAVEQ